MRNLSLNKSNKFFLLKDVYDLQKTLRPSEKSLQRLLKFNTDFDITPL